MQSIAKRKREEMIDEMQASERGRIMRKSFAMWKSAIRQQQREVELTKNQKEAFRIENYVLKKQETLLSVLSTIAFIDYDSPSHSVEAKYLHILNKKF